MVDSRLNKWQREIEELSGFTIKQTDDAMTKEYKKMLTRIKKEASEALEYPENLTRTDIMRQDRRIAIAKQIEDVLAESQPEIRRQIKDGVTKNAEIGYYGNWYEMEQTNNLKLQMNMLDSRKLEQIVTHPVNGKRFSQRLYSNRKKLARQVNNAIIAGIESGMGYRDVADRLDLAVVGNYNRAVRIARTESMRANSEARQLSNEEAVKAGVQFEKQWMATLDSRTRDTHQDLDGQRVAPGEMFKSPGGGEALEPRMFGIAEEDIQCRCTTINIVGGIEPSIRMARNADGVSEKIEFKSYDDWLGKKINEPVGSLSGQITQEIYNLKILQSRMQAENDLKKDLEDLNKQFKSLNSNLEGKRLRNDLEEKFYAGDMPDDVFYSKMEKLNEKFKPDPEQIKKVSEKISEKREALIDLQDDNAHKNAQDIKAILNKQRKMGINDIDLTDHLSNPRSKMTKIVRDAYDCYPTDWIKNSVGYDKIDVKKLKRGYYLHGKGGSELALSGKKGKHSSFRTAIHELGHRQEKINPKLVDAEREFYEQRTKGESLVKLNDINPRSRYRKDEVTRVDNFINPYMGKDYGGDMFELFTMAVDTLYTDPTALMEDKEMFEWVVNILLNY